MNKTFLFCIILSVYSSNILADSPSFDFFEIGYTSVDIEGEAKKYTGYDIRGSYSLNDNFYIGGDSFSATANIEGLPFRRQIVTLGVGFRFELSSNTTTFAEIDGVIVNPDGNGNHENGYELTAGIRTSVFDWLELKTSAEYLETESFTFKTFVIGGTLRVYDSFAIYSDLNLDSNSSRYSIGMRYSF